ncbi:MAG: hypothetical protein RLZZ401_2423, partial [Pseudomonadota bacterium]
TASNHIYTTPIVLVGKKFWDKLSTTERQIFRDAAAESQEYQRRINRDYNASAATELKARGMLYSELSATERDKLRAATRGVTDKFAASYDAEAVKLFRAEVDRVRTSVK